MNDLAFYSLLIYLVIRVIGLGIALDFYYNTRQSRFKLAILGWGFWVIASISSVYSALVFDQSTIELLLFINTLFVSLGAIIYIWVIFSYFLEVPQKLFLFISVFVTILFSTIFIMLSYRLAVSLARTSINFTLFSIYIVPLLRWRKFKESMGTALKWYYAFLINLGLYIPISIYITYFSSGYYGLYHSNDAFLILLNYIPSISFLIILVILLIHVEYNFSNNQRFELKDKYSHNLGNILQFISGYIDLVPQNDKMDDKESSELQESFKLKCKEAAGVLREIREL
ncbi:MAG: hypothetical protein ACFFDK_00350 [Promethearchaeota archaeon]